MDYQKILKQLAKFEGEGGKDKVEDAPGKTVPYGAEDIFSGVDWKKLNDLELANKVIELLVDKQKNLENYYGINYTTAPDSFQEALLDLDFNVRGSVTNYKKLSDNLEKGNYVNALKETLDVVSATDDEKNKSEGVLSGLVKRRALKFNEAIQNSRGELISPLIQKVKLIKKEDNNTDVKYIFDDGTELVKSISKPIHSGSKKKSFTIKEEQLKEIPLPKYANILQTELKEKPPIPTEESLKNTLAKRRAGIY